MDWFLLIIRIVLYIIPMYLANSSAMVFGGKTPLDLNKNFVDGKPVFGKGKTFKGTFIGIATGTAAASIIFFALPDVVLSLKVNYIALGFLLALGAIVGDIVASFFKRRNNIPQGTEVLFLDQLDFVIGGMIFGSLVYVPDFYEVIVISVSTLIIHKITNFIAYKIRLKKVPW